MNSQLVLRRFANEQITVTTAEGSVGGDGFRPIEYRIEAKTYRLMERLVKSLTLSFYVKFSHWNLYVCFYRDESTDRQLLLLHYSLPALRYKTITIPGDTGASITNDSANRTAIYFHAGAGSDWTSTDSSAMGNL